MTLINPEKKTNPKKPVSVPKNGEFDPFAGMEERRLRPMHVHAGVSWTSLDKEPIVTVTAGWEGQELTMLSPK